MDKEDQFMEYYLLTSIPGPRNRRLRIKYRLMKLVSGCEYFSAYYCRVVDRLKGSSSIWRLGATTERCGNR